MRIAFLADAQSPNTHGFVTPLAEQGHDVRLLSLHTVDNPPAGVKTDFLSAKRRLPKRLYLTKWPAVRRWLREIEPDLVVAYRLTGNGLLATLAGHRPLVVVPTGTDVLGLERRPKALTRIVRHVLRKADGILCWAPHMAAAAIALRGADNLQISESSWNSELPGLPNEADRGAPDGPALLLVQPRGVNRKLFAPPPVPDIANRQAVTLVTTRSLKATYRHDLMIRAMAHLERLQPPRVRLAMAGGGPDGKRLWELASRLGVLDSVDFLGPVAHGEIPRTLAGGSVYVSLIDYDGVSASLLEAMSVGLYPVVGDSDAARVWIRDGWNGSLVRDDRPEPVAKLIHRLCSQPALREEVVKRNWRLVEERADLTRNSQRIADWFGEVVARRRHSARSGRRIA